MKHNKKLIALSLVLIVLFSSTVALAGMDKDIKNALKNEQGKTVLGNQLKDTATGLSVEIYVLVRNFVIVVLVIAAITQFAQFKDAGDDPPKKSKLQKRIIYIIIGIILVGNFWDIYEWVTSIKLNLGKS